MTKDKEQFKDNTMTKSAAAKNKYKNRIPAKSIQELTEEIRSLKEELRRPQEEKIEVDKNNPEDLLKDSRDVFKLFPKSDLENFDWEDKNLKRANFEGMDLSDISFKGSDLQDSCLQNCVLKNTDFSGCNLTGADFGGAYFSSKTNFHRTKTKYTVFSEDSLVEVEMLGVKGGDYLIESSDDKSVLTSYKTFVKKTDIFLSSLLVQFNAIEKYNKRILKRNKELLKEVPNEKIPLKEVEANKVDLRKSVGQTIARDEKRVKELEKYIRALGKFEDSKDPDDLMSLTQLEEERDYLTRSIKRSKTKLENLRQLKRSQEIYILKIKPRLKKGLKFLKKYKTGLPQSMMLNRKIKKALDLIEESKKSNPEAWTKSYFRP